MSGRGEVVVRVRKLAENTVAMEAARAASIANAARDAAELADRRTREHPLRRGAGRMNADQLIVAAGAGAALRESAAVAAKEAARARAAADEVARRLAQVSAERQAAERFLERREAADAIERARKDQRSLDESGLATWGLE